MLLFYSLSGRIYVVQLLFSEVFDSFVHNLILVLFHYLLLSFQNRFALLHIAWLNVSLLRFNKLFTPIIVVTLLWQTA